MSDEPGANPTDPAANPAANPADPAANPAPTDDWRSALPEDMRGNATLQDIKSVEVLTKRFLDTKSMVGNSLRVPGEDASAEDVATFRQSLMDKNIGLMAVPNSEDAESMQAVYKALGLPDEANGYTRPENWTGMTDERFGFLSAEAHKAGLSKKQFESISASMAAADNTRNGQYEAEHKAGIDQLKGEWGNAYDQKVSRATNVAKQLDAPAGLQEAMAAGQANADTLRWMDGIADKLSGEANSFVKNPGEVNEHTPTELRERMQELTAKMMEMDVTDPMYQGLLDKRMGFAELLEKAG